MPKGGSAVNLARNVVRSTHTRTDRATLRRGEGAVSYRKLDQDSASEAGPLRGRGRQPEDRVGLMPSNTPEFAVVWPGGGVVVR